jgi:nucleoside-diphosphate-sugar epimerase
MGDNGLLVIGSSGFVGRAVVALMVERGMTGVAMSRRGGDGARPPVRSVIVSDYEDRASFVAAAAGCRAAIMLAGLAHVVPRGAADEAAFFHANRDIPFRVAENFAAAGGRRFVFVSSVAVNGTISSAPVSERALPAPVSAYGRSKFAGEQALTARCAEMGLELVIIRPPLVYGPGAPGNFGKLLRAAKRGTRLPLGSIDNRRDFIGLDNLADLLLLAAPHPAAAGQTFLVSDGEPVSTADLARRLYAAAGHEGRVLRFPPALLRLAFGLTGRSAIASSLIDDLLIDSSHVRSTLGWRPPLGLAEGLERSVSE